MICLVLVAAQRRQGRKGPRKVLRMSPSRYTVGHLHQGPWGKPTKKKVEPPYWGSAAGTLSRTCRRCPAFRGTFHAGDFTKNYSMRRPKVGALKKNTCQVEAPTEMSIIWLFNVAIENPL
jgi:hypothetical protein